jgi:undecaprenyl-diphosphatase
VTDIAVVYGWALVLYAVTKDLVHRHRPPPSGWLAPASGWAFPSGHTAQATVAWGLLCVLACVGRSPRTRTALISAATLIVLLVAASRFYLGVHWLTDVLAGMSLGVAILSVWGITRLTVFFPVERREEASTGQEVRSRD